MVRIPDPVPRRSFSFRDTLQGFLLRDLVFAQLLDREIVQRVFTKHGACFGGVFHTSIVLWAFMSQVLRDGKEASCRSAVARVSSYLARFGMKVPDSNTGDCCKEARTWLSNSALRWVDLSCNWLSHGRSDGTIQGQSRHTDFRKGKRVGKKDHIVVWPRSTRPEWMSKEEYAKLPQEIKLREIGYMIVEPGRKQQPFVREHFRIISDFTIILPDSTY